jgi:hypothetical protein
MTDFCRGRAKWFNHFGSANRRSWMPGTEAHCPLCGRRQQRLFSRRDAPGVLQQNLALEIRGRGEDRVRAAVWFADRLLRNFLR